MTHDGQNQMLVSVSLPNKSELMKACKSHFIQRLFSDNLLDVCLGTFQWCLSAHRSVDERVSLLGG